jgi:hypothetical protein
MRTSDYVGFGFLVGFGLWWLIFPRSVIRLYTSFHRGTVALPRTGGIRIAGAIWMAIVVFGAFTLLRTKQ